MSEVTVWTAVEIADKFTQWKQIPEEYVTKADHDAALDAAQARVKELEDWQRIVLGTGTDQEAVIRMAASEYTKTAVQCWRDANETLQAQIRQVGAQLNEALGVLGYPVPADTASPGRYKCGLCEARAALSAGGTRHG